MLLRPLLTYPDDWTDLIPGVKRGGPAYWAFLEVPFQCFDPDGKLLAAFRNLRHPNVTTPTRHWPDSIRLGGLRSKLVLSIYLKGIEMVRRGKLPKELHPCFEDVLRIEARMKKEKLIGYFGHGHNVEVIDGYERLTSFYPAYLVTGHRDALSKLHGVFRPTEQDDVGAPKPKLALGQLLARAAKDPRCGLTFHQLLADLKHYTGAGDATISDIRKAGEADLSRMSSISSAELFSDTAYASMCGISSPDIEMLVDHSRLSLEIQGMISAAYCPPYQPLCPFEDFPDYFFR